MSVCSYVIQELYATIGVCVPPQTLSTKTYAQVRLANIAQKTKPNVTISIPGTQTAIAEVDPCPLLTGQVASARTSHFIYPLSLFLSLALLNLRWDWRVGRLLSAVVISWARFCTTDDWQCEHIVKFTGVRSVGTCAYVLKGVFRDQSLKLHLCPSANS